MAKPGQFHAKCNYKPKSRKLQKTIQLNQTISDKLSYWLQIKQIKLLVAVCMEITYHFINQRQG